MALNILTFNIHKGFNWNNSKLTLEHLKKNLEEIHPDIVFLQEVVGENILMEKKFDNWIENQFEFLAKDLWNDSAYSQHAVFDHRHHGNVILSKYPIKKIEVKDISQNNYEQRSILYCELEIEGKEVHTFCTHLNLLNRDRLKQYKLIKEFIQEKSDNNHPIILAGDFNDWNQKASHNLFEIEHMHDAHKNYHSDYGRTFPAMFPLLKLDRIYTRGFKVSDANVLDDMKWKTLSDHLPIHIKVDFDD